MYHFADTDDSCFSSLSSMLIKSPLCTVSPTSSPISTNETFEKNLNQEQFAPFSLSILAMNSKGSSSESGSGSCGTSIVRKFKSEAKNEVVVPPSDTFCKRKKIATDHFLGESSKMIDRMISTVETVVSNRQNKTVPEDNELTSMSVTIAYVVKDIPQAKRRICLVKILQIIEDFAE